MKCIKVDTLKLGVKLFSTIFFETNPKSVENYFFGKKESKWVSLKPGLDNF